jgi:DNA-binding NtrC family response regulator
MNQVQEDRRGPRAAPQQADILIVDDDPDLLGIFAAHFGKDYRVIEAVNGQEALTLLATQAPRLMVLDCSMPGMSGLEVLKTAKIMKPSLPVIMLTSERNVEKARHALLLGAREFVTKPFDAEYFRVEFNRILDAVKNGAGDDNPSGRPWRIHR